ncbi:MAG: protein translocase subunit SecF [Methanobacteriaceae archaeon]
MLDKFMESYKLLIAIPLIITILSVGVIAVNGLEEGIELQGGSIANLKINDTSNLNSSSFVEKLKTNLKTNDISILSSSGNTVAIQLSSEFNASTFSSAVGTDAEIVSYNSIGPVLSKEAMTQVYWALAFAFIFMSITVFIIFRSVAPSLAVIAAALSDIIIAIGGMSIFGIPLSIASVGALLMLIGYSVDTDILLTTRILRRKEGTITERAKDAIKTGLTMSLAAIASMIVLYVVTILFIPEASTLSNIAAVLIIGLVADIATTWLMNLGILRWYVEGKKGKSNSKGKSNKKSNS